MQGKMRIIDCISTPKRTTFGQKINFEKLNQIRKLVEITEDNPLSNIVQDYFLERDGACVETTQPEKRPVETTI